MFCIAYACVLWLFYLSFLKRYVAHFYNLKRIIDSDLVFETKAFGSEVLTSVN